MNIYSHLVVASVLEADLKPGIPPAYYWGAVAPDIRYLAGIRRNQTHIPASKICAYMEQYPNLRAFLQGYLVHCLTDEVDLETMLYRQFPLNLLKGKLTARQIVVLLELFYLENVTLEKKVSGDHNAVLAELGIDKAVVETAAQAITRYLSSPSWVSSVSLAQELGMLGDSRIDKYLTAAEQFQTRRIWKKLLFLGLHRVKITDQVVAAVREKLQVYSDHHAVYITNERSHT